MAEAAAVAGALAGLLKGGAALVKAGGEIATVVSNYKDASLARAEQRYSTSVLASTQAVRGPLADVRSDAGLLFGEMLDAWLAKEKAAQEVEEVDDVKVPFTVQRFVKQFHAKVKHVGEALTRLETNLDDKNSAGVNQALKELLKQLQAAKLMMDGTSKKATDRRFMAKGDKKHIETEGLFWFFNVDQQPEEKKSLPRRILERLGAKQQNVGALELVVVATIDEATEKEILDALAYEEIPDDDDELTKVAAQNAVE